MTKIISIISVLAITTLSGCGQVRDTVFLNKIFNDFSRSSYFIVLDVTVSNNTSQYLIENSDLFFYFHKIKYFSENEYKKSMISIFHTNKPLIVAADDIKRYGFINYSPDKDVQKMAKQGKAAFISKYFENNLLKDGIKGNEKYNIVKALFDWNIASRIDDETGYLMIDN